MAWIFGSKRANKPDPVAVGLRVQSSMQGVAIPIGCGRARWSGNLIDYDGFTATPAKSPGAKGGLAGASGKGNTGQYNYTVSGIVSLGEGGILAYNRIHNGSYIDFLIQPTAQELTDLSNIGINSQDITVGNNTYHAIYHYGNYTDGPDSWWSGAFPGQTPIAYPGQAYVIFPNIGLGSSPSFPSFSFDCTWSLSSDIPALGPDANPADWIQAFLTNADWGVQGFPSSAIGDFATAKNYWRATGMMVSVALTAPTAAQSHLKDLIESLNADFRWSNGNLDIVPYGDMAVSGNGYTYTPNTTPVYNLGVDDYLPNQGSLGNAATGDKVMLAHSRADASQIPNIFQIEYLDRVNLYNPATIYQSNDAQITSSGRRRYGDKKSQHWFCLAGAASQSVALQLHRAWTTLNTYQFTVGRQFILLDVLDIVTISEPALQLSNQLVRITEIQENSDGTLTMTAEEVPLTASAPVYFRQKSTGLAFANQTASSVNTPIFYEPPDQLGGGNTLWIGLSGQIPANFGGANVWMSVDNENFGLLGAFEGQSRMGVTTSAISAVTPASSGVTIDSVNTLGVNLTECGGNLLSSTASAVSVFASAFVVDSEVLAYQTATLTGSNAYNLTTLARGGYGSAIAAHASGVPFLRLDGDVFEWTFDASYIGKTLYFKFASVNSIGAGAQNLEDVSAYAYTIQGAALASPLPSVTKVYTNFTGGFLDVYWDEVKDYRTGVIYEIRSGSTWSQGATVAVQAHPPFRARGNGTFWIAARCQPIAGLTVYSATPISITIAGNVLTSNVVLSYDEQANGWPGTLGSGISIVGSGSAATLTLQGVAGPVYYKSAQIVDIGYQATASINASLSVVGSPTGQNILSLTNILTQPDILGSASTAFVAAWVEIRSASAYTSDIFAPDDIYASADIYSASSPWGSWQKFVPGSYSGRLFQFRLALASYDAQTLAIALAFNWLVSVPLRIDHYQNLTVSSSRTITFQPDGAAGVGAFNGGPNGSATPYVSVSWPATAGDTYTITSLSTSSLTINFFNGGVPVTRSGVNVTVEGY